VSSKAPKRVTLSDGRVRYAQPLANAYSLSALGWAAVQGGSLPASLAQRVPADRRRKSKARAGVTLTHGGQNAPPDESRIDSDLSLYGRAHARDPDASAAAPDRSRTTSAPAKALLAAPAGPYSPAKALLGQNADRPTAPRPQARPATSARVVDAQGALARLQRAADSLAPPATSTRPASILRAAEPPPPRPIAELPPAWRAIIDRQLARAREEPLPASTATRDPAPPPRDPAWGALADELARRGGSR
jgi:hypothetical protein